MLRFGLHFLFPLFLFNEFSSEGGSEEELAEGSDEIITKEKKPKKKETPVSRGKRIKKKRSLSYLEESDEEKQDYGERLSEDRVCVPQGVRNVDEESSSEEREVDESSGALRENVNGEEESDSEGHQDNSNVGGSPREMEKSHIESSSLDGARIAEISDDDAPLVNDLSFTVLLSFFQYMF